MVPSLHVIKYFLGLAQVVKRTGSSLLELKPKGQENGSEAAWPSLYGDSASHGGPELSHPPRLVTSLVLGHADLRNEFHSPDSQCSPPLSRIRQQRRNLQYDKHKMVLKYICASGLNSNTPARCAFLYLHTITIRKRGLTIFFVMILVFWRVEGRSA